MTMAEALDLAVVKRCCARPVGQDAVAYQYKASRGRLLLSVNGLKGLGKRMVVVEEFNPALSRSEINAEWELCDLAGQPVRPPRRGLPLGELGI